MSKNDTTNNDQPINTSSSRTQAVEITNALPIRLHAFDLARHAVISPDGRRFVVATSDDTHIGRGYITTVYPQQNDYLTLVRLTILETTSNTPEEAIKRHISVAQAIQQGKLQDLNRFA
ncbi:MAG TPA: hypothetical protein VF026_17780 [Ktedonobacteraceae bacterium]